MKGRWQSILGAAIVAVLVWLFAEGRSLITDTRSGAVSLTSPEGSRRVERCRGQLRCCLHRSEIDHRFARGDVGSYTVENRVENSHGAPVLSERRHSM